MTALHSKRCCCASCSSSAGPSQFAVTRVTAVPSPSIAVARAVAALPICCLACCGHALCQFAGARTVAAPPPSLRLRVLLPRPLRVLLSLLHVLWLQSRSLLHGLWPRSLPVCRCARCRRALSQFVIARAVAVPSPSIVVAVVCAVAAIFPGVDVARAVAAPPPQSAVVRAVTTPFTNLLLRVLSPRPL